METQNKISCFLVKVASRCNLDCDYCYMYHHVDQSWRKMPAFLSLENEELLAFRIAEYAENTKISRLLIIYHGGEPLLVGVEALARITNKIRESITCETIIDFSLQTNGTLLTDDILSRLEELNISVSLSIDGPAKIHDKHRLNHSGKPSFSIVERALKKLSKKEKIFTGIIGVIDPIFNPSEILEYFNSFTLPSLDFLLPDANYNNPPPGREENPNLYLDWMIKCFDLWFDNYSHLRIRLFDSILDSLVGLPSKTDALGFGDVSLITIETDGNYHDLDVLKVAYDGATNLNLGGLATNKIEEAILSNQIQKHRFLLTKEGLSSICQKCAIVDICAGGAVPHRYSNEGFSNPSIYCYELFNFIAHVKKRLSEELEKEVEECKPINFAEISKEELSLFEDTEYSYTLLEKMLNSWSETQIENFRNALLESKKYVPELNFEISKLLSLNEKEFKTLSLLPSVYAWTNVIIAFKEGKVITSIDGIPIPTDFTYVQKICTLQGTNFDIQLVNREDYWLRCPFGEKIKYESHEVTSQAYIILKEAYKLIDQWDRNILKEIKLIAPEIQFIKDSTAHPDKIVSFSDNSVPGALYVTIKLGDNFINAWDLADSILHEYRHQKLYLLQRISDIIAIDIPLVNSPWREELRPPSGLFHAIYVFTFLRKFWTFLALNSDGSEKVRAKSEVELITKRINQGVGTVKQTKLTKTGSHLLDILEVDLLSHTL